MKQILFFFLALLAGVSVANAQQLRISGTNPLSQIGQQYNNTRGVLYNQIDSIVAGGISQSSQQFPDFSNFIVESADEFVVPAGNTWSIDSIDCVGVYYNGAGPMTSVRMFIYADSGNAGITPGALVYGDSSIIPITPLTNPSPTYKLHNLAVLPAGKYWITTIAVMSFAAGGQWGITLRNQRGAPDKLRDRGNLFATGTAWQTITSNTPYGLAFRLRGTTATQPVFPQNTTCRNGINVVIPDNLPAGVKDSIQIPQIGGCTILDVNVKIDTLLHTYDSDLTFDLTHGATTVRIINAVGTSGDNFIGTVLNDSAATLISAGVAPFTGAFKPSNPLSAFNSTTTNGNWVLLLVDHAGLDSGSLKAWCVSVTYQCPTGGITTIEIPNTYKLNQNYPNPFNPTTTISYGMPKSGNVKLVVYDIVGREVRTLVNEFKTEGTYNVSFDASSLASGVYFYTLKANDFTSTKKMLLVK